MAAPAASRQASKVVAEAIVSPSSQVVDRIRSMRST
jgi:hypothetical protein